MQIRGARLENIFSEMVEFNKKIFYQNDAEKLRSRSFWGFGLSETCLIYGRNETGRATRMEIPKKNQKESLEAQKQVQSGSLGRPQRNPPTYASLGNRLGTRAENNLRKKTEINVSAETEKCEKCAFWRGPGRQSDFIYKNVSNFEKCLLKLFKKVKKLEEIIKNRKNRNLCGSRH